MARRPRARYEITAEDRTRQAVTSVEHGFKRLQGAGLGLRSLFASIGAAFSVREVIRNTVRQEQAMRQLEQRVTSTGRAAGFGAEELAKMAAGLQQVTTFGDEAVMEMQALLLTFTNIRGDVFVEAQEAVLNLSTAMGTSATAAAQQLGRALNDPISGLSALSRSGIQFSDAQRQMIRDMVAANDVAGAQRIILQELETQFGGSARAARDTLGGALTALGNAFGDLLEVNTGLDDARESIETLVDILSDPATIEAVNRFTSALITGLRGAVETAAGLNLLLFGPSDPLLQLDDEIRGIDRQIAQARQDLVAAQVDGWVAGEERANQRIAGLLDERARLVERYWEMVNERGRADTTPAADPDATAAATLPPAESEEFRKAAEALERRLGLMGRETLEQQTLWEIERGRYADLAANEQQALLDLARRIDARQADIEAAKEVAQAEREAAREAQAYERAQEQAARAIRDTLDPIEPLRRELEQLDILLNENRLSWDEWAEATLLVQERMDEMVRSTEEVVNETNQYAIQAARNLQSAFSQHLYDPFEEGLEGMFSGFVNILRRMAAEIAAAQLAEALFGDISSGQLGGSFGGFLAGLFHEGGVVGSGGGLRMVDPAVFLGARRYHTGGLAADEVPAILQRGEEVLTADDPRHRSNGGGVSVQMNIQTPDVGGFRRSQDQVAAEAGAAIQRAMRRGF